MYQNYYVISGTGKDSVGLVGTITSTIAKINGNIVDLRQDVIHGLFSVVAVVDMSESTIPIDKLDTMVKELSEKTGLGLRADKYSPVPGSSDITTMLLILLGTDKPGVIASVSELLGNHNINIELSKMIAREDVFLMDLLVDISNSSLPVQNLKEVLSKKMADLGINTLYQTEDVFNKKKKVIVFDIAGSFVKKKTLSEIMELTGISGDEMNAAYSGSDVLASIRKSAACLENLPEEVLMKIIESVTISAGTLELVRTLKMMGYKIVLISTGFSLFTDYLKKKLNLDYSYGFDIPCDDDSRTFTGDIYPGQLSAFDDKKIIATLIEKEAIGEEDITILTDEEPGSTPGIALEFDMKVVLNYFNQHILSKEALMGVLGSFGIPEL
ncbi:MAG: hypothetical protein GY754_15525 [bacterium]|nr:hypothetical protein [bacterium]